MVLVRSALFMAGLGFVFAAVVALFLLEIRRMVGQDNLWRLLTGHYRRPRDEERMDLVGSTGIAERLASETASSPRHASGT